MHILLVENITNSHITNNLIPQPSANCVIHNTTVFRDAKIPGSKET